MQNLMTSLETIVTLAWIRLYKELKLLVQSAKAEFYLIIFSNILKYLALYARFIVTQVKLAINL